MLLLFQTNSNFTFYQVAVSSYIFHMLLPLKDMPFLVLEVTFRLFWSLPVPFLLTCLGLNAFFIVWKCSSLNLVFIKISPNFPWKNYYYIVSITTRITFMQSHICIFSICYLPSISVFRIFFANPWLWSGIMALGWLDGCNEATSLV